MDLFTLASFCWTNLFKFVSKPQSSHSLCHPQTTRFEVPFPQLLNNYNTFVSVYNLDDCKTLKQSTLITCAVGYRPRQWR